jgi:hypothetical protein
MRCQRHATRTLKFVSILVGSIGLLFFNAYGNHNGQGINHKNSSFVLANSLSETTKLNLIKASQKGQVVESGAYHLELVPEKSNKGVHLDLFVQRGDNHQPIPNAKVTGQVQLPNGKQKNLTFTYDAKDKHYTSLLNEKIAGQYQLKITAEINGKKVNARFSFKQ